MAIMMNPYYSTQSGVLVFQINKIRIEWIIIILLAANITAFNWYNELLTDTGVPHWDSSTLKNNRND